VKIRFIVELLLKIRNYSTIMNILPRQPVPGRKNQHMAISRKLALWLKRLGLLGFLFFFIKGLVWLAVFFGASRLLGC